MHRNFARSSTLLKSLNTYDELMHRDFLALGIENVGLEVH